MIKTIKKIVLCRHPTLPMETKEQLIKAVFLLHLDLSMPDQTCEISQMGGNKTRRDTIKMKTILKESES